MSLDPRSGLPDNLSEMLRAVKEIESFAPPNEWVLVAPDGRVWRQRPEELMQVLALPGAPQSAHSGEPVAWLEYARKKPSSRRLVFARSSRKDLHSVGWVAEPLYAAPQPVEREPMTHAQAKTLVSKYGNDPLHLVYQVEVAHGIKGGQHGAE